MIISTDAENTFGKIPRPRNSLAVQWLGLSAFTAVARVRSLVGELRSCKPCSVARKKKNSTSFYEKKTSEKQEYSKVPQHDKSHRYENPTANIILSGERLKEFPLRLRTR